MKLNRFLTPEEFNKLNEIQKLNPILTFQNNGYEYIDKDKFNDSDWDAFNYISELLKDVIIGFSKFNNFCHNKSGELRIRIQYNWGAEDNTMSFTGVGYVLLDELLNGFTS